MYLLKNMGLLGFFCQSVILLNACVQRTYHASPKIVAGDLVEESDPVYTSTVSLDSASGPICTGFVFDARTIVTAAHCLAGPTGRLSYTVTFGSRNRKLTASVDVPAKQVLAHAAWDRGDIARKDIDPLPQYPKSDIGLLVLSEDIPSWVKPLPVKEIGDITVGRDVVIAGYGQTRELPQNMSTSEFKGFLRKAKVKLATINEAGKELIWQAPDENVRASSCHGDSGGPMYFIENDGSLTVIGVTSRAYSAALDCQTKGVYTDVRKYVGWIKENSERIRAGIISTADWQHRIFNGKDSSKISLDYKLAPVGIEYKTTEVWLNVSNQAFTGKEEVQATLSSYINSLTQQKLKMEYAGENRFTVRFDKFNDEKVCAMASRWGVKQDIQISVDGKSLSDAVSGESQFNFKFCESK